MVRLLENPKYSLPGMTLFHGAVAWRRMNRIDFEGYLDVPLAEIRKQAGLEADLLTACYRIEKERYPESVASQRLLGNG